ncbi:alpha/beta hydrolase family protein [Treponema primitia ZAS-2]|uniref:Alpha/beta hydrolase family protein n=1 Tax=Treponema primitia (strain ATCC BAA-887 / DSM 12427 / ZAS-2) TaxID=545694 RepID=F5YMT4_TREPZ|nr:alpha/beta hydrolase [Treponema primitia]AEF85673.1 alpha/beta hydrolase family protein [Treponema primitia ZAS-2]
MAQEILKNTSWTNTDDGTRLFTRRWMSSRSPRATVLIVHGMAEHSRRYEPLALRLAEAGFESWAADARGHGLTADRTVNDPGKGGLLGHCADKQGFRRVVADLDILVDTIKQARPELPLFILGHSWGSFLTQSYIEAHGDRLAGCLLSGTRGPGGLKYAFGASVMGLIAAFKGSRRGSKLAFALGDGPYNNPFKPNRTPFDWLSRDESQVDAFAADPLCGNLCSSGFYRDLTDGLNRTHRREAMEGIPRNLPIYVFCGSADPVGDMGESPTALVNGYRAMGIKDLEFVVYPDARHELLNETNREEVMSSVLDWLTRHCKEY